MKIFICSFIFLVTIINCSKRNDVAPSVIQPSQPSQPTGQSPSDTARVKLIGIIDSLNLSDGYCFDTKDNLGHGMDCAKIIDNPNGGYIAVYHHVDSQGIFYVYIAKSTNLLDWTYIDTLASNASQPAIQQTSDSGYVVAWEQTRRNHVKVNYYNNLTDLFNGISSKSFDIPQSLSSCAEGTPNIYSASKDSVIIGFHYYMNCVVDRQTQGVLVNFNSWSCSTNTELDDALIYWGVKGNIGDRDFIKFNDFGFTIIEGQFINGDFGSFRSFLYDNQTKAAVQLNIKTPKGSTNFANPTVSSIHFNGKDALVMTFFVPSKAADCGEAGELIYYRILK
jgi:hypothetical protein